MEARDVMIKGGDNGLLAKEEEAAAAVGGAGKGGSHVEGDNVKEGEVRKGT